MFSRIYNNYVRSIPMRSHGPESRAQVKSITRRTYKEDRIDLNEVQKGNFILAGFQPSRDLKVNQIIWEQIVNLQFHDSSDQFTTRPNS